MENPDGTIELKVGDAITLDVTRKAQDVPGMVFSPLPEFSIEGLGIYPASPQINDRVNRGSLTGERTDSVNFICEREGTYRIPEIRFQWWDPGNERLEQQTIEPLQLAVEANPAWVVADNNSAAMPAGRSALALTAIAASVLLAIVAIWYVAYPRLKDYLLYRQKTVEASERWAFRKALQACESGIAAKAYQAITLWLGRVESSRQGLTLMMLAEQSENTELKKEATALQERVASGLTKDWKGGRLAQLLVQSREGMDQPSEASHVLQPLNP